MTLLWLIVIGGANVSANAAEITLDFSKDGGLLGDLSNKSNSPSTGNFEIGGYSVDLVNCSQQSNKTLVIAGNGETGSITFTFSKSITSVKFMATEVSGTAMTVTLDGKTIANTPTPVKGENTVDLTGNETKEKKCTFSFTKKTKLTSVTFVTSESSTEPDDTPTEWVKLLKYNDGSEVTDGASLPAGQVLKLESQVEGLMTNSAIDNDYVITYTLDGTTTPTFSGKKDSKETYWTDPAKNKCYIYRRGIALTGNAGDKITVKISVFPTSKGSSSGYEPLNTVTKTFTLTESTQPTAKDFTFAPSTTSTYNDSNHDWSDDLFILDITESCTATGNTGNTIIAKYSTDATYDIQQILNAANVSLKTTTAGVFSTEYKLRKTSAIQITPEGIISSEVARAFYWYIPARKDITLEAVPSYSGLSLTGQKQEKVTLTAYYMNGTEKVFVPLDILGITIKSNDKDIATSTGELTYPDANDKTKATFTIEAKENGTTRINVHSNKTSEIDVKTANGGSETHTNYNAAATDVTVKVVDGKTMAPPTINPETSDYHISFKSSVQADAKYSAYYYVEKVTSTADAQSTPTPEEIKTKGTFIEKGQKIETDIEAGDGNVYTVYAVSYDEPTQTLGKRVVQSTYTYVKIENPVLTPGIEGYDNTYSFDDDELTIVASVATAGAQVYYTINSADENVTKDNGILYDGSKKITINKSARILAVAYKDGIYSDVVFYRYNMVKTDLDAPEFIIDGKAETEYKNIGSKKIKIQATYTDAQDNIQNVVDENDKVKEGFTIYYTTDGQLPSDQSATYQGAFSVLGTVKTIYAYVKSSDGSISDRSVLTLTNDNLHVWETTEDNCPGGVLSNTHQELKSEDGSTTWVKADFGGFASADDNRDNKEVWDHYTSKEVSQGTRIDKVGYYSIAPNIDAKDEMGVLYNHSKANTGAAGYQTHKSTFGLPAMGAYTKFEPQMDGTLTIYCFQEGALYYRDAIGTKECFNSRFLRKRPVYFIDEAGVSIAPEEVVASGTLSSKWKDVESTNFADKGEIQNGITQNLFSKKQTEDIYNMFNNVITKAGATSETSLSKLIVYLNDGEEDNNVNHKAVAGYGLPGHGDNDPDNVVKAKTGVCIPSASFMKYTFKVEGGKTYFFFGWMTKVGIRGFGFEPDATQNYSGDLTINTGKTDTDGKNTIKAGKYAKVTLNRTFAANRWTTLVLPFSVSASQVQEVFGTEDAKAQILHYRSVQGNTMYFFKHYHQMIVAGTPVLIKPTKEVENPTFTNVNVESTSVTDTPCNDYGYKGEAGEEASKYMMKGSYNYQTMPKGSYYLSKTDGTVKHLTKDAPIGATFAYMTGANETLTAAAKTSFNNLTPTSLDDETTGIDFINADGDTQEASIENGYIYNISGQLVGKNIDDINKLSKGIYIVNGKKMVIQ